MGRLKIFATDGLGVLFIIAAIAFGWLPGPGGVPLAIAGLSLLSINHEWAKRLLKWFKDQLLKAFEQMNKQHPAIHLIYDIVAIILIVIAIWRLGQTRSGLAGGAAFSFLFLGIGLFSSNRGRLDKLIARMRGK